MQAIRLRLVWKVQQICLPLDLRIFEHQEHAGAQCSEGQMQCRENRHGMQSFSNMQKRMTTLVKYSSHLNRL